MDTFTISAAARICRCDRRTLQRAIHAGRLQLDAQHCLSREALLAAGYLVADTPHDTPQIVPQARPQIAPHDTPHGTPQDAPLLALLERLALAIADLTQEVRQLHTAPRRSPQLRPHIVPQYRPQDAPHIPPQETQQATPPPWSQEAPQPSPHLIDTYDPQAAVARIQALHRQGFSTRAIAAQLNAEGVPTRHGQPWGGGSVGYLLRTHGSR
jgi:hypothetical protein